jgi:adenosylcobinamide-phosphate synthase
MVSAPFLNLIASPGGDPASPLLAAVVLAASLVVDRAIGDPHSRWHPVALLGRFIGWWGRPSFWPVPLQRIIGVAMGVATILVAAVPYLLFEWYAPWYLYLIAAPFLLKACIAWRSLEEHVSAVAAATRDGDIAGRAQVQLMVSRKTDALSKEQVLSGAYESASENLVDSIVAPLLFFACFGLGGAAAYRAANTMDAMLGYRDERIRIGWFPARLDDVLNFIPARITGLVLLVFFTLKGRFREAWRGLLTDARKRPGYNGGIPMALIANGVGVRFEKPGVYTMGRAERSLEKGGADIIGALRAGVLILAGCLCGALFLCWYLAYT